MPAGFCFRRASALSARGRSGEGRYRLALFHSRLEPGLPRGSSRDSPSRAAQAPTRTSPTRHRRNGRDARLRRPDLACPGPGRDTFWGSGLVASGRNRTRRPRGPGGLCRSAGCCRRPPVADSRRWPIRPGLHRPLSRHKHARHWGRFAAEPTVFPGAAAYGNRLEPAPTTAPAARCCRVGVKSARQWGRAYRGWSCRFCRFREDGKVWPTQGRSQWRFMALCGNGRRLCQAPASMELAKVLLIWLRERPLSAIQALSAT